MFYTHHKGGFLRRRGYRAWYVHTPARGGPPLPTSAVLQTPPGICCARLVNMPAPESFSPPSVSEHLLLENTLDRDRDRPAAPDSMGGLPTASTSPGGVWNSVPTSCGALAFHHPHPAWRWSAVFSTSPVSAADDVLASSGGCLRFRMCHGPYKARSCEVVQSGTILDIQRDELICVVTYPISYMMK